MEGHFGYDYGENCILEKTSILQGRGPLIFNLLNQKLFGCFRFLLCLIVDFGEEELGYGIRRFLLDNWKETFLRSFQDFWLLNISFWLKFSFNNKIWAELWMCEIKSTLEVDTNLSLQGSVTHFFFEKKYTA